MTCLALDLPEPDGALAPVLPPASPEPPMSAPELPLSDSRNRLMWIHDGRVFYAGLLGEMSQRRLGSWMVYASLGAPLRVTLGGGAGREDDGPCGRLAVVPPYLPHRVACDERLICSLGIEPETVDPAALPGWLRARTGVVLGAANEASSDDVPGALAVFERLRATHAWLRDQGHALDLRTVDFDACFFGHRLTARALDPRIAQVLRALTADPSLPHGAQDWAAAVGLSFSRFLHLFKQETGVSFRSLRSWKRAGSLLHHVTRPANLAHLALDLGYPDSTHFSHSIRQVYGLKPRDLFAGSRRLRLLGERPAAAAQSAR